MENLRITMDRVWNDAANQKQTQTEVLLCKVTGRSGPMVSFEVIEVESVDNAPEGYEPTQNGGFNEMLVKKGIAKGIKVEEVA